MTDVLDRLREKVGGGAMSLLGISRQDIDKLRRNFDELIKEIVKLNKSLERLNKNIEELIRVMKRGR